MVMEALSQIGVIAEPGARTGKRSFACTLSPEELTSCLTADGQRLFLLDSADPSHPDGRFSVLGVEPWCVLRATSQGATVTTDLGQVAFDDALTALGAASAALHVTAPPPSPLPFAGGGVGFFSYDLGRTIETLPDDTVDDLHTDDLFLAYYDWVLVYDHRDLQWTLAATARRPSHRDLDALLDAAAARLGSLLGASPTLAPVPEIEATEATSNFSRTQYVRSVGRALEHIFAGDIYQVNLSQRFAVPVAASPFDLYRHLRRHTHAVFSAYLAADDLHVLSLSPERFLRVQGRQVETSPIKGTRPRGATPGEDAVLARDLVASTKDQAELAMIVDLERNDLGRVCEAGSVRVSEHAALYTLATVHHTVTTVVGRLRADVDVADLLRATFPGGSITGAPKIRAMEIIEDLEPTRRGVYTGSVGYLGYDGRLDLNIAIRTVSIRDGVAYVQAGGGIVADSDPEAEYEETLTKARALLAGLGAVI